MSSLRKVYKGMNGTVEWPFNDKEGNPLNLNNVESVTGEVIQKGRVVATYVMADGTELRKKAPGSDTVVFEYTNLLTNVSLAKMVTSLRITIVASNDDLEVDDDGIWTEEQDIFEVI